SNEPGYYKAGEYGIRVENLVLVVPIEVEGAEKPVLGFETLTFAPIERALIEVGMLTENERAWVDDYHGQVLQVLGPQLDGEDLDWLRTQCATL
ncbi:MAG: M24 family metallopeptidase C-terminal domain-containing protein, partial [Allosphingosinicella sp.]